MIDKEKKEKKITFCKVVEGFDKNPISKTKCNVYSQNQQSNNNTQKRKTTEKKTLTIRSTQASIRVYRNLFKLINNITITYLDIDYETAIKIHYDGSCQGVGGFCEFGIDNRFLPSLSFDHFLRNYRENVLREGFEYIKIKDILGYNFDTIIQRIKTQIGGLKLVCKNCHFTEHHTRYNYPSIFTFLQTLSLKVINDDPNKVIDKARELAEDYFNQNEKRFKISKSNPIPTILYNIKISILKFVNKKFVITFLFGENYTCPICGKANINDHLDIIVAHHTNRELLKEIEKIEFHKEFDRRPIDWLIENIIIQECIFICHNCHTMLNAFNYRDNVHLILNDSNDVKLVNDYYDNLGIKIKELRNIILEWKRRLLNGEIQIKNPFPSQFKIFEFGSVLEKRLVCIYYICNIFSKEINKDFFTAEELSYILDVNKNDFFDFKDRLINLRYIKFIKHMLYWNEFRLDKDIYQITFEGIKNAKQIILTKKESFPQEFNVLVSEWRDRFNSYYDNLRTAIQFRKSRWEQRLEKLKEEYDNVEIHDVQCPHCKYISNFCYSPEITNLDNAKFTCFKCGIRNRFLPNRFEIRAGIHNYNVKCPHCNTLQQYNPQSKDTIISLAKFTCIICKKRNLVLTNLE